MGKLMALDLNDSAAVGRELWGDIEHARFGMLSVADAAGRHFHPMTTFPEPESAKIWSYTRADSELARNAGAGAPATLVVVSKNFGMQASIIGRFTVTRDLLHRDKFWNPVVSAWFPCGKDESALTMLCLKCEEAEVGVSDANGVRFGWEIAKANLTGSEPNVGGHVCLKLS
jgi:general stress protein 26